ncbi:hypothetical protein GY45DRAFT_1107644 [Cubamyces sp. BRFM 1775]|nr:hypothetical protein GY45DRAFT_1107644 [Cubamyces sp. BRFM 1775]
MLVFVVQGHSPTNPPGGSHDCCCHPPDQLRCSQGLLCPSPASSPSPMTLGFVDIFDVPERLEDQRRHIRSRATVSGAAMSSAGEGNRSSRRATSSAASSGSHRRQEVKPLPSPILFDGPARRPYSSAAVMHRAQKVRPPPAGSPSAAGISRLPLPEVFSGPSRLRPYNVAAATRGSRRMKGASAAVLSMVPLVVSGVGVGLLFGID